MWVSGLDTFEAGTVEHGLVLLILFAVIAMLIATGRAVHARGIKPARELDCALAMVLFLIRILLCARDLQPARISWDRCLFLQICDILGFAAPLALVTGQRQLRAIVYFWGLLLSSQAFIFPVEHDGPARLDFWAYFVEHGMIVAAAIYDVTVRGFRPTWRDWQWTVMITVAYLIVVLPIDFLLHVNYGYLGNTRHAQRSAVMAFGPWPARVPRMVLIAWGAMALMTLVWKLRSPARITRRADAIRASSWPATAVS